MDFVVYVVPPGSGDGLQGSKKGVMEIADMVAINKYDGDYKRPCERLKRQIEGALTLSIPKHQSFEWYAPVELVSARQPFNVEAIWKTAEAFRKAMGEENLRKRRSQQIIRGMWRFLGDAIMKKLRSDYEDTRAHRYTELIQQAERDIVEEKVSGHEAAMKIINAIFKE